MYVLCNDHHFAYYVEIKCPQALSIARDVENHG